MESSCESMAEPDDLLSTYDQPCNLGRCRLFQKFLFTHRSTSLNLFTVQTEATKKLSQFGEPLTGSVAEDVSAHTLRLKGWNLCNAGLLPLRS